MFTEDMVLSDSCGRSWLGANTLYISIKSDENMMGTSVCPGVQEKDGGTVSRNFSSRDSRNKSVLKGMMLPALAFTRNWLAISGAASCMNGCAFISLRS